MKETRSVLRFICTYTCIWVNWEYYWYFICITTITMIRTKCLLLVLRSDLLTRIFHIKSIEDDDSRRPLDKEGGLRPGRRCSVSDRYWSRWILTGGFVVMRPSSSGSHPTGRKGEWYNFSATFPYLPSLIHEWSPSSLHTASLQGKRRNNKKIIFAVVLSCLCYNLRSTVNRGTTPIPFSPLLTPLDL